MTTNFETKPCTRCNSEGGIDSFLHVDGGRCWSCGGSGRKLTKKGLAEKKSYVEAHTIQAGQVEAGMTIIISRRKYQVLDVVLKPDSNDVFGGAVGMTVDKDLDTDFRGRTTNVYWENLTGQIRLAD